MQTAKLVSRLALIEQRRGIGGRRDHRAVLELGRNESADDALVRLGLDGVQSIGLVVPFDLPVDEWEAHAIELHRKQGRGFDETLSDAPCNRDDDWRQANRDRNPP